MKEITCIIVDDEEKVANRMKNLVTNFTDLKVIQVETNAKKAIKKICSFKPDIVFLDVEMPGKTGFELIDELRDKNCRPAFILVTAFNHYTIKAIKEAAFDYLMKPVDVDELKECIERYKSAKRITIKSQYDRAWIEEMNISQREEEIIRLIVQGKISKEIGEELFLSKHTVDTHRRNILAKTGLKTSNALIAFAIERGMNN